MKKKLLSANLSAFQGHNIEKADNIVVSVKDKLNKLGITDVEQLVALWAIEETRPNLVEYLAISEAEVKKVVEASSKIIPQEKLAKVSFAQEPEFDMGALKPPEEDMRASMDIAMMTVDESVTLPASVDWSRSMPNIRNQGSRGTCVAFALTALHEFFNIKAGDPQDFSEQHLYYETKLIDGSTNGCGTWQNKAVIPLAQIGQCRESVWPYNPNPPCNNHGALPTNARADAANFKLLTEKLNPRDVNSIKSVLAGRRLVAFSIPVFNSWYLSADTKRTGRITMPLPNEASEAGHAMCFIGYQDDTNSPGGGYFMLRNSWGTGWGSQCPYGAGNGTIPYAYISGNNWEAFTSMAVPSTKNVPIYRYWNVSASDHFYTTNWNELKYGAHGWAYEGIQCYVFPSQQAGTVPLYRYWNGKAADHFYTTNWSELGGGAHGWKYEGIQCYVFPTPRVGTVPLYRYWNGKAADHFYTTNWGELGGGAHGWRYEGIQCYVYSLPLTFSESSEISDEVRSDVPSTFQIDTPLPILAAEDSFKILEEKQTSENTTSFKVESSSEESDSPSASFQIDTTKKEVKKGGGVTISIKLE